MSAASGRSVRADAPHILERVLARTARTGIYLVRGLPRDLQRAARARAVSDGTTLSAVLVLALRDYAAGTWSPRRSTT
jgi:hypothetical protein